MQIFFFEASLPPLRVTLTHFFYHVMSGLFSQCPFQFQVWPELGVKPRLCRSSWRAFVSTHLLVLPSTFLREALLACPLTPPWSLSSLWSPPFLLHAATLIPLSLTKVQLSLILTLSHLTIWYFGLTARFLFLLAKAALAYLPTALSMALRPLFPFQ